MTVLSSISSSSKVLFYSTNSLCFVVANWVLAGAGGLYQFQTRNATWWFVLSTLETCVDQLFTRITFTFDHERNLDNAEDIELRGYIERHVMKTGWGLRTGGGIVVVECDGVTFDLTFKRVIDLGTLVAHLVLGWWYVDMSDCRLEQIVQFLDERTGILWMAQVGAMCGAGSRNDSDRIW